jgi:hypothetical protein
MIQTAAPLATRVARNGVTLDDARGNVLAAAAGPQPHSQADDVGVILRASRWRDI